ncbi:hypothetical protein EMPS_06939 [Entomortierella parvispora]|uniref:Cytochrome b5 heme-binding domain-containing protein n=1 Tax=Entomortierella parvispora TaxID=205924 RepID=A0A9P3HDG2_9FUNG|nr:hypothetical protein EMPS_06939 [Entomortierella parvispora]
MSFFLSAIKDYVYPSAESDASSANPNATKPESAPSSNPYSSSTAPADRIIVQPPSSSLSIPSVSLNSLQPPTITASSDSDDELDSDDEKIQKTPSLQVSSSPYAASAAAAASVAAGNPTPSMTLSTAEDPDEETPSFPALNGPQRLAACATDPKSRRRIKFALAPGHSPMDWARLTSSGADLRGVPMMGRYTLAEVKTHNRYDDAWTVLNGKVYNITPYLPFHQGGEKELMRCAGRDGTRLFNLTHKWVNYDYMLKECQVGFLVNEAPTSYQLTA